MSGADEKICVNSEGVAELWTDMFVDDVERACPGLRKGPVKTGQLARKSLICRLRTGQKTVR